MEKRNYSRVEKELIRLGFKEAFEVIRNYTGNKNSLIIKVAKKYSNILLKATDFAHYTLFVNLTVPDIVALKACIIRPLGHLDFIELQQKFLKSEGQLPTHKDIYNLFRQELDKETLIAKKTLKPTQKDRAEPMSIRRKR